MPSYDIAYVRELGQNMILIPLDSSFGHKPEAAQNSFLFEFEKRAHNAGLRGQAAAVWETGGRTETRGPRNWAGFLGSLSMALVLRNVNKKLSW
jgi:hypothetical protein